MTGYQKNALVKIWMISSVMLVMMSCDRTDCKNTNTVFDKYSPHSKEYKDELVQELTKVDKSKLSYWMGSYQEKKALKYIQAYIQGDGLCAIIILTIKNSDKGIQGIINSKGMGYSGAKLEDLKFDTRQDSTSTEFVFREINGIVD